MERFSYDRAGDLGRWWAWDYEPCATWSATAAHSMPAPWNRPTAMAKSGLFKALVEGAGFEPA